MKTIEINYGNSDNCLIRRNAIWKQGGHCAIIKLRQIEDTYREMVRKTDGAYYFYIEDMTDEHLLEISRWFGQWNTYIQKL